MAVKIKRERPDQRRHHRVTAPLFVRVDGHRLRATDWSLGGLRIDGYPGEIPVAGAELPFHLTLPFQGFDVSFDIKAEVVRINAAEKMFAVRYTEGEPTEAVIDTLARVPGDILLLGCGC